MATREGIRRRLLGARSLRQVVRTMKTLATVRIGMARRVVAASNEADATLALAFAALLRVHPTLADVPEPRADAPAGVIAFGSDHGLCGPFNDRLARHAAAFVARLGVGPRGVLVVGRRLRVRMERHGVAVARTNTAPAGWAAIDDSVAEVFVTIDQWLREGVARIVLVHHRPVGAVAFRPHLVQLWPLDPTELRSWRDRPWPTRGLPIVLPSPESALRALVRQHVQLALARAFAASLAAENGARLAAMEAAERNVDARVTLLEHASALARQSAITAELLDVQAAMQLEDS